MTGISGMGRGMTLSKKIIILEEYSKVAWKTTKKNVEEIYNRSNKLQANQINRVSVYNTVVYTV
jgi:L-2-hydroxyglutarate oxidase LhgO